MSLLAAKSSAKTSSERIPFMAFAGDEVTRAILVRVAQEKKWPDRAVREGGVDQAIEALAHIKTPRQLIVDLSASSDPLAAITALAEVCDVGTQLIALGQKNDVNLFRGLMALGVQDYLLKPVSPVALNDALARIDAEALPDGETEKNGELVCVIGARGGVGASTVAANLAHVLAHELDKKTALVDLDLHFGSLSLAFDLEPGRGFRDALEHPDRIDGLFIERAMVKQSDQLSLLSAEEELAQTLQVDAESIEYLFEPLRSRFDVIVVEVPRGEVSCYRALLAEARSNVIVSDASLAGLRDTVRLANFAKELGADDSIRLVLNKIGLVPKAELKRADFEHEAELTADAALDFEAKIAGESMAAGKPMVALKRRGKLVGAIRDLGRSVLPPEDDDEVPASFWKRKNKQRKSN